MISLVLVFFLTVYKGNIVETCFLTFSDIKINVSEPFLKFWKLISAIDETESFSAKTAAFDHLLFFIHQTEYGKRLKMVVAKFI